MYRARSSLRSTRGGTRTRRLPSGVPRGVRFTDAAGRRWHRHRRVALPAKGAEKLAASRLLQKRIAELNACIPVGGCERPSSAASFMRAWRGPRLMSGDLKWPAAFAKLHGEHAPLGLQGAGPRAVQHAADRPGSRACGNSVDASGRSGTRLKAFDLIKQVLGARGDLSADDKARLNEVARLFGVDEAGKTGVSPFRQSERKAGQEPHTKRHDAIPEKWSC